MVREGFPEEVVFEDGEEQGCAFQGLEWPVKIQQAVKAQGLPGSAVQRWYILQQSTDLSGFSARRDFPIGGIYLENIVCGHLGHVGRGIMTS